MAWEKKPAIVRYVGVSNDKFTNGKEYYAYFLEYWQGERNSLHVSDNAGRVTDFNRFEDFMVISDKGDVLNHKEAVVRCISQKYDDLVLGLTSGRQYKAIGRDKDGCYLVMDDSYDCYFYPSDAFEIIEDKYSILAGRSVYYSYHGGDEIQKY